ncbi:MAG: hypothetical protein JXK16_09050 [Thiotrichales bacterium]|nr:hypothetical protein [Thiotrichales bacterium]
MVFMTLAIISFLCSLAGLYRLLVGPSMTDRIIGLDLIFAIGVLFCLLSAWINQNSLYLDVAIGLALTGFIATLAWSKLIQQHKQQPNLETESEKEGL